MITYEKSLEQKIEDLETHIEALEDEIENLSCKNDSYEALCVEMFEEMVILKASLSPPKTSSYSRVMYFLKKYIKLLDEEALPEEEEDE